MRPTDIIEVLKIIASRRCQGCGAEMDVVGIEDGVVKVKADGCKCEEKCEPEEESDENH